VWRGEVGRQAGWFGALADDSDRLTARPSLIILRPAIAVPAPALGGLPQEAIENKAIASFPELSAPPDRPAHHAFWTTKS